MYLEVPGVDWDEIAELVEDAYRMVVPRTLLARLDAERDHDVTDPTERVAVPKSDSTALRLRLAVSRLVVRRCLYPTR
ncbi:MAG: hypothetical protein ABR608_09765 [Pseudonocardiaceae bacterium]